jgi:acetyl-CoA acetyltransferase
MSFVYVIGTSCTPFGKFPDKSFKDLTSGKYRALDEPGLSRIAAERAYAAASCRPISPAVSSPRATRWAATGLSMIHDLALQLRGEAGERQAAGAGIGLA